MTGDLMTKLSDSVADSGAVAFVGRVSLADGSHWCPVTHGELKESAQAASDVLVGLGLRPGDAICFVSRHSEAVQFASWELAAQRMGLISCHVEATRFDAHRLTLYFSHLPIKAVIGLTEEVMDNLGVELRQVIEPDTTVVALEPLAGRLRGAGIDALTMALMGPALALECKHRDGLHLDDAIWTFTARGGRIYGARRGEPIEAAVDTGFTGTLVDGECGCGVVGRRLCR